MTELVHPSPNRRYETNLTAGTFQYGALTDGWIAEAGTNYLAQHAKADQNGNTLTLPLNAFAYTTSGLTVTVQSGEAFVEGGWMATDETHSVTLDASTANQTVYIGWDRYSANTVIVGKAAAFDVVDAPDHPKLPLATFSTDATTVIATTDHRAEKLGPSQSFVNRTYDADGDGVIDDSARVGGIAASSLMRKDQSQTALGHITFGNGFNVSGGAASFSTNATFSGSVNFNGTEAQGFRIENRTSRPTSPAVGQLIYRSDRD